jgi:hypothetical protein
MYRNACHNFPKMASTKKHYSSLQKKMLEFIEENATLVKQKISNQCTSGNIKSKWAQVTEKLSATYSI